MQNRIVVLKKGMERKTQVIVVSVVTASCFLCYPLR